MGLRIRTNIASLRAQRYLADSSEGSAENMTKLSSGYRINKAADDAAGLAIADNMRKKIRSLGQAKRNAADSVSLVQIAEGGMSEVSNMLVRLRELAIQASTDTLNNNERTLANREYVELVDEIDRIAKNTEFNGVSLLAGGEANDDQNILTFHIGDGDGSIENTDTIVLDLDKIRLVPAEEMGLTKESEIGPFERGDAFERETAAEKLTIIDDAMNYINGTRAELGAKQSRLLSAINSLDVEIENTSAAKSRIHDVDFASETASFTQNRILQQSGVSVLTHANSLPEVALSLLR